MSLVFLSLKKVSNFDKFNVFIDENAFFVHQKEIHKLIRSVIIYFVINIAFMWRFYFFVQVSIY